MHLRYAGPLSGDLGMLSFNHVVQCSSFITNVEEKEEEMVEEVEEEEMEERRKKDEEEEGRSRKMKRKRGSVTFKLSH
ncbi:hypothetical protein B296_00040657 [Ensete ventricosum]|uniref:Uncharacterized protein n=1 Tax=Ensete ventricosum TaxID=4639 RepID=A0A426ZPF3_ENSVE|nr:hypothetical protein B296_00040657 [Ensete ventricosum]